MVLHSTPREPLDGLSLRIVRLRRRLRQDDVAGVMGVTQRRVAAIEATDAVTARAAARYLEAIAELDRRSLGAP